MQKNSVVATRSAASREAAPAKAASRGAAPTTWDVRFDVSAQHAAGDEYRFVDEVGNEYRYRLDEQGDAVIVDCVACVPELRVPEFVGGHAVAGIGDEAFSSAGRSRSLPSAPRGGGRLDASALKAFAMGASAARNAQLESVTLPSGVRSIGRAAFRGCSHLREVNLPDTLESIDDYAFSCTALEELVLPASCTNLAPLALRLGPQTVNGAETAYSSPLVRIGVQEGNPAFRMVGPLLCRVLDGGACEALLCPGQVREVAFPRQIVRVTAGAFAGTTHVGALHVRDGLSVAHEGGLLPGGTCETVFFDVEKPGAAPERVTLEMPDGTAARKVLDCSLDEDGRVSVRAMLGAYDEALADVRDPYERARLMVARLAHPVMLLPNVRAGFLDVLEPARDAMLVHFGARAHWQGYEHMMDAGLLAPGNLGAAAELLASRGDTLAAAQLLQFKRARFKDAMSSYAL